MTKNPLNSLVQLGKTKIFTRSKGPLVGVLGFFKLKKALTTHQIGAGAKKAFAVFALFLMSFMAVPFPVGATLQDDLNNVNDKINEARDELADIKAEKNSLQGQINAFNREINSIEYQISLTDKKIALLNSQIIQTQKEFNRAEADLKRARLQLSEIVKAMYEDGQLSTLEVVVKSGSFSEYVNRSEYMEQMQVKVKDNADTVVALKNKLEMQKKLLETNKQETVDLRTEQASQRNEIGSRKSAKDNLLIATKGNEVEYQALLKKLQKEQDAIEAKMWSGSNNYVSLGTVKKGDIIGYIGNSGYSSGPHLHFETRSAASCTIKGKSYNQCPKNPLSYIGDGYFEHPATGPGVSISQYYGSSSWTSAYSFHTGMDLRDGGRGTPVRAAADGEIIYRDSGWSNTFYLANPVVTYGNVVKIRHSNGMYTLYAHLR